MYPEYMYSGLTQETRYLYTHVHSSTQAVMRWHVWDSSLVYSMRACLDSSLVYSMRACLDSSLVYSMRACLGIMIKSYNFDRIIIGKF